MAKNKTSVEDQIKACAKKCGLSGKEAKAVMGAAPGSAKGAWDGARLQKILKFIQMIAPIILPLIMSEDEDDDGKD